MSEIKNCKKCNKEFVPTKGLISYCSLECRNSRSFSIESRNLKSLKQKQYFESLTDEERLEYLNRKSETCRKNFHTEEWYKSIKEKCLLKYISTPFEELGPELRRRRILEEQAGKCAECDLSEWRGVPLSLEIEHKNGNHQDNSRSNLCALCPNCHSITPTWRGRNKPTRNGDNKVSDEELIEALKNTSSIRQALLSVGMAAKGANYDRAKKLLTAIPSLV